MCGTLYLLGDSCYTGQRKEEEDEEEEEGKEVRSNLSGTGSFKKSVIQLSYEAQDTF